MWINIILYSLLLLTFSPTSENKVLQGSGAPGDRCEFENGVLGTCETKSSCTSDGGIISRNGTMRTCTKTNGQDHYCCRRPFQIAQALCDAWKTYWRSNNNKCIHTVPMIVGGKNADVGQFPELAIVGIGRRPTRVSWQCGGTLVSPHFVLTAAHCVIHLVDYMVKMGEHHLTSTEEGTQARIIGSIPPGLFGEKEVNLETRNSAPIEQIVIVEDVIIYPEYDFRYHDLALLKLKQPVVVTKRALPACLPTHANQDYLDQLLTIAGWGRIQYDDYEYSNTLQKVAIPIKDSKQCESDLKRDNPFLIPKGVIDELMCAGAPGKDSCSGDSGGPLLLQTREGADKIACEHSIIGIISFGNGCGNFGMYAKVASYIDWITGYIAPGVVPAKGSTGQAFEIDPNRLPIRFPN